jgi:hypothetical protein
MERACVSQARHVLAQSGPERLGIRRKLDDQLIGDDSSCERDQRSVRNQQGV